MMDKKTLKALKESIAKWEKNTQAKTPTDFLIGADKCPLCKLFLSNACYGCPIANKMCEPFCLRTPYRTVEDHFLDWKDQFMSGEDCTRSKHIAIVAAKREVKFLKSLLPKWIE